MELNIFTDSVEPPNFQDIIQTAGDTFLTTNLENSVLAVGYESETITEIPLNSLEDEIITETVKINDEPSHHARLEPNSESVVWFDAVTGLLSITGTPDRDRIRQWTTDQGYYEFDINGQLRSANQSSSAYDQALAGAHEQTVSYINFKGLGGADSFTLETQTAAQNLSLTTDATLNLAGTIQGTGRLDFQAPQINVSGDLSAQQIQITASEAVSTTAASQILAEDSLTLQAPNINLEGTLGVSEGRLAVNFTETYRDRPTAQLMAANGSTIHLNGGNTGILHTSGDYQATGATGGNIEFFSNHIALTDATLDASGTYGGGKILIGGEMRGNSPLTAQRTFVDSQTTLKADAIKTGNGGNVVLWSEAVTGFYGQISAQGGKTEGNGGFVEVSSQDTLIFNGHVNLEANQGQLGTLLLDPRNIRISNSSSGTGVDTAFTDGQILNNDFSDTDIVLNAGVLQAQTAEIILEATNDIIIDDNVSLNFTGTGSRPITFRADADNDGIGSFVMSSAQSIATNSRDLNIFGASITTGAVDTRAVSGQAGSIRFKADNGTISAGNLSSAALGALRNAGEIYLEATAGITTGTLSATTQSNITTTGNGGAIALSTTTGNLSTGGIQTFAVNNNTGSTGQAGAVTLSAPQGNITVNGFILTPSLANNGNAGNGGKVTINAGEAVNLTGSSIPNIGGLTFNLENSGVWSFSRVLSSGNSGNGGEIIVEAPKSFNAGNLLSYAWVNNTGNAGQGGNVRVKTGENLTTTGVSTYTTTQTGNSGFAGQISLIANNGTLSTSNGSLRAFSESRLNGNASNGGAIALTADRIIQTSNLESGSAAAIGNTGTGGKINVTAKTGDLQLGTVSTRTLVSNTGNAGAAGEISIIANQGNLTIDQLSSRSISNNGNAGNAGEITAQANPTTGTLNLNNNPILAYSESTSTLTAGNGGTVELVAANFSNLPDILTYSQGNTVTSGGAIKLTALNNLITRNLNANSSLGTGGLIHLISHEGEINTLGGIINTERGQIRLESPSIQGKATLGEMLGQSLTVTAGNLITGNQALRISEAAKLTTTLANTGNVLLVNTHSNGTKLGNSVIGGNLTINSLGRVSQIPGTRLNVAGRIETTGTENFDLVEVLGTYTQGNDQFITQVGRLDLPSLDVTGNLQVKVLENGLQFNQIYPGDAIVLTGNNNFAGEVSLNTAFSGTEVVNATPEIRQNGVIKVGGEADFDAGSRGSINLGLENDFNRVKVKGNRVLVQDLNQIDLAAAQVTGNLTVRAGNSIIDSGEIHAATAQFTTSENQGIIEVDSLVITDAIALETSGDVIITNATDLNFLTSTIGGNLTATAKIGNISDRGQISVAGDANFITQGNLGNIDLDQLAIQGAIAIHSTGNAKLINALNIHFNPSRINGNLTATALTDGISNCGDVIATGDIFLTGDTFTLDHPLQGNKTLTLQPLSLSRNINIGGNTGEFVLTPQTLAKLGNQFTEIRIGHPNSTGTITLDTAALFNSPVKILGGNTLIGANRDTLYTLTGTNTGTLSGYPQGLSFENIENLQAGTANDTFQFNPNGRLNGNLDGGNGFNLLDYTAYNQLFTVTETTATGVDGNIFNIATYRPLIPPTPQPISQTPPPLPPVDSSLNLSIRVSLSAATSTETLPTCESTLWGTRANDILTGAGCRNRIFALAGKDWLLGNQGNDTMYGGQGEDTLHGGKHHDLLFGDRNSDSLCGDRGHDTLVGGEGNDQLWGGKGNDSLNGGDGNDTLSGDLGTDTLTGGRGRDVFMLRTIQAVSTLAAADLITDFDPQEDRIRLSAGTTTADLILEQVDGNTVIRLRGSNLILGIVANLRPEQLQAAIENG